MKKIAILIILLFASTTIAQTKQPERKTKFYNFDELLIEGKVKKPQVLYTDARQKVKFERLLKLRKDFLPNLKNTRKDLTLR